MVEHESHFVTVPVAAAYTSAKSGNQIIHVAEQDIGQHHPLEVALQSLDNVQTGVIGRESVN